MQWAQVFCIRSRQNHSHTAASARSSERRTRAAGRLLWWFETIWGLICDNLTLAMLGVQRTILFTLWLSTCVLSPNWNRLLCLRLQETAEESFTHWISYLYTLNTIEHHRMMKTTHTVTVLSKPFCTTMHAFSWTLPHYLLPWQGAGDAADTSIGAGPGPSPVLTDGAGCGLALTTKGWWLYGVNMCKCYFQWFVYFFFAFGTGFPNRSRRMGRKEHCLWLHPK